MARAKNDAKSLPCKSSSVQVGTCNGYRFIVWAGNLGGNSEYFAMDGRIVGASLWSDNVKPCSNSDFGFKPSCEAHVEQRLCNPAPVGCQPGDPLCLEDGVRSAGEDSGAR